DQMPLAAVAERGLQARALADDIIGRYLGPRPKPAAPNSAQTATTSRPPARGNGNGIVPATLVSVGGMDGRWGRRLYLQLESLGRPLRLFGTGKELGEARTRAG